MAKPRSLIAIVDDEGPVRKALSRLLRSFGLEVESFSSGSEFIESLATHTPDCIVLDLHMPNVNGFEVQEWLAESTLRLPVVIITGHDSAETRTRAMKRNPVAFLVKPVNDHVLRAALALALGHSQARDRNLESTDCT